MDTRTVTVGVAATVLADQGDKIAPLLVIVQNNGAQTVYVGGADVDASNGYRLAAGQSVTFSLSSGKMYGLVAATTASCVVVEDYAEGGAHFVPTLAQVLGFGKDAGSQQIKDLADPTAAQDATTKAYADAIQAHALALVQTKLKFSLVAGGAANADLSLPGVASADTIKSAVMLGAETAVTLTFHAPDVVRTTTDTTGDVLYVVWLDVDA